MISKCICIARPKQFIEVPHLSLRCLVAVFVALDNII